MPSAELTEDGLGIVINAAYADNHLVQMLPGVGWRDQEKCWYVRASWPACLTLRYLFGQRLDLGPRILAWAEQMKYQKDLRQWLRMQVVVPDNMSLEQTGLAPVFQSAHGYGKLFDFQAVGSVWMAMEGAALEADEMGSGKTIQSVTAARVAHQLGSGALPMLVVCPESMRETWRREITKWWPDVTVRIIMGSAGQRRKILEQEADVYIIGWAVLSSHTKLAPYASIRAKRCPDCGGERSLEDGLGLVSITSCEVHERELNAKSFKTVVADEAHRAKDPHAKQTRAWWWLAWHAPIRHALTGTPIESSVGDLWSILHGLDPIAFPGKSKFLDLFATMSRNYFGGNEVLGLKPESRELFYAILSLYMRRLPKEVTLPFLPAKMPPVYRYPEMSAKQKKPYEQMTKSMLAALDDGSFLTAGNPLEKVTHQISLASACGVMVGKVCRVCKGTGWEINTQQVNVLCESCQGTGKVQALQLEEPSCKIDDLVDFMKDFTKPLVVWTVRRQLAELTAARLTKLGVTYGMFTGAQDNQAKQAALDNFQAGRLQVFLGTIRSGAQGITLTRSDTAFYMQRDPSLIYNRQSEDRIHRIGSEQHDAINYIISLTAGTIEQRWEERYGAKDERFEEVVQDKKTLRWLIGG